MNHITILIVEDHTIVREGFRRMLEFEKDIIIVGEAHDGREAIQLAKKLRPNIILMDIAMPGLNGIEATKQILKINPSIKVLILSAHNDDAYVQSATDAGALGFLLKQTSTSDVCQAIRHVMNGKTFFSPTIARRFERMNPPLPRSKQNQSYKKAQLTSRELEVLQLVAEGNANKQTASKLGIGIKTVEKHREHLMEKLDIHDTAGLTRYAISAGIIESSVQITIL